MPEDGLVWTGESYDNTSALGANTWRHVAFIEQQAAAPARRRAGRASRGDALRWLMSSDVCKHCTHAACLDVCPTGALFRTEFGTVVVQEDVCNGCGYCVPACPFGVIDRRELPAPDGPSRSPGSGRTRLEVHALLRPAQGRPRAGVREGVPDATRSSSGRSTSCASARRRGSRSCEDEGWNGARLYGEIPDDGVGGFGAFFLLLDEPEVYGLPPDPVVDDARPAADVAHGRARRRRARRGRRGRVPRRRDGDRGHVVLRPADPQGARLEAGDPVVLLHRRPRRRVVGAEPGGARLSGQRAARPHEPVRGARGRGREPGAPDQRPRAAGALPQHAARVQGDLADDALAAGSSPRAAAATTAAALCELLGIAPRFKLVSEVGVGRLGRAARRLHGDARLEHRGSGLARGATRAALRVRVRAPRRARARRRPCCSVPATRDRRAGSRSPARS